jgi:hypothetical protein
VYEGEKMTSLFLGPYKMRGYMYIDNFCKEVIDDKERGWKKMLKDIEEPFII